MLGVDKEHPIHLLINPRSGYGGRKQLVADLRTEIRRRGLPLVEYVTQAPADATRYVRDVASQAAIVIVWGGDGTISEVANGLAGLNVPILPCPAGTENLLATQMRIPHNPRDIARILDDGQVVQCDLGQINDRRFLLITGIGFDGEVVRRLSRLRTGHISHLSYFWPMWRTFWEHRFPRMRVEADGEEIFDDMGMAFIGNMSRYAVGLRICRDAVYDDGQLDLVIFRCREQWNLMLHAAWTLLRLHPLKGDVIYRRVRHCRIETRTPVSTQADGDVGPDTPVDVSVCPHRIKLLIPQRHEHTPFWPWRGNNHA